MVAALNIAAGVVVIRHPEARAEALTMFAALLFLTGGVFRLVGSVVVRGPQMGWTLLQGAFGLLLGLLVLLRLAAQQPLCSRGSSSRWPCSSTASA